MSHRTPRSRPLGRVEFSHDMWHVYDGLTGTPRGSVGPSFSFVPDGDGKWITEYLPAPFERAARWARLLEPFPSLDEAWSSAVVRV